MDVKYMLDKTCLMILSNNSKYVAFSDTCCMFREEVGEKFERKKVRIVEKVELFSTRTFSSNFFLVHIEAGVLQKWHSF